jgi:hypothetical protein
MTWLLFGKAFRLRFLISGQFPRIFRRHASCYPFAPVIHAQNSECHRIRRRCTERGGSSRRRSPARTGFDVPALRLRPRMRRAEPPFGDVGRLVHMSEVPQRVLLRVPLGTPPEEELSATHLRGGAVAPGGAVERGARKADSRQQASGVQPATSGPTVLLSSQRWPDGVSTSLLSTGCLSSTSSNPFPRTSSRPRCARTIRRDPASP